MKANWFVRKLASNNRRTREKTFEALQNLLAKKTKKMTDLEMKKLWKGLYYAMWFSDRPLPQKRLATKLSQLFGKDAISKEQFADFAAAFWYIIDKEWPKMDKWRADKYLLLMRYVVKECFRRLQDEEWDEELVKGYTDAMESLVLSGDNKVTREPTFHLSDVWVDELERVLFGDEEEEVKEDGEEEKDDEEEEKSERTPEEIEAVIADVPVDELLQPFARLYAKSNNKGLRKHLAEDLFSDPRLSAWGIDGGEYLPKKGKKKTEEEEDNEDSEDEDEDDNDEEEDEEEEWTGFGN